MLNEERYEAYKLSETSIDKEQALIILKDNREELRKELKNLDIYKKYMKKAKLQKEYEEITEYLKKKEELKKKERYIEESISSRNGVIDEVLLNDIKDENSLYFSILDMKSEEEKKLIRSKEIYSNKRSEFENLFFIEDLSSEDKNKFMKAIMERENLKEKIKNYGVLNNDINLIKKDIEKKKDYIGSAINFRGIGDEIGKLLEKYEDKLKELKFKLESSSNNIKEKNIDIKLKSQNRLINLLIIICSIILAVSIFLFRNNLFLIVILTGVLSLLI